MKKNRLSLHTFFPNAYKNPHFCWMKKLNGNCFANFWIRKRFFCVLQLKKVPYRIGWSLTRLTTNNELFDKFSYSLYYLPFVKSNYRSWKRIWQKVSSNKWDVNVLISSGWKWEERRERNAKKWREKSVERRKKNFILQWI